MRLTSTTVRAFVLVLLGAFAPGCSCGSDSEGDVDAAGDLPDTARVDAARPDGAGGDGGGADAATADASLAVMSLSGVFPQAASRTIDTELTISGERIVSGATVVLSSCDTATSYTLSPAVVSADGTTVTVTLLALDTREQGLYTITVTNPDGQSDRLECALRVIAAPPPTVTNVVPPSAYAGAPADGVSSDTQVTITGTGFRASPGVRWVKRDGTATYDALYVGFISDTQLTAVVPSETLAMTPGAYDVYVINPDLLVGQWILPDLTPGTFSITTTPPPHIGAVSPVRIEGSGTCGTTDITITGSGFADTANVYYVAPAGAVCVGSILDGNGATLCPLVRQSAAAGQIVARFGTCPANGPYPLVVVNPDAQADYYYSISLTPSSDGHLNVGAFEVAGALVTPRWRHGSTYGFDVFGGAHLYAVGGQDTAGGVLETTEVGALSIYGVPGAFDLAQQYVDLTTPRAPNALEIPRQGGTLVRVGDDLFYVGGAAQATDTVTTVAAESTVERARILSYDEMPGVQRPVVLTGGSLPEGAWYYQVSAVGPWGESLGSREVVALRAGGTIRACWTAPSAAGVVSYNLYRSLAADGRAGSTSLIAAGITGNCFDDDGTGVLMPGPANLRGQPVAGTGFTAGVQHYRVSATTTVGGAFESMAGYAAAVEVTATDVGAGNAAIQLAWDVVPGATGYDVYRFDDATDGYLVVATGVATTTFVDTGAAFGALLPRDSIPPLAAGSLSRWSVVAPSLGTPREGADGVVVTMDPATSGGVAARILIAGGRTDNTTTASYLKTAESLGVMEDGTLEPAWFSEAPLFTNARAYYALVTTQDRDVTPFPPEPEEPPCGDFDGDGFVACACATGGGPADCDDTDPNVYPGAPEICGDGIDQDCDAGCGGSDLACACADDTDADGHVSTACGGDDCCDAGTEGSLGCAAGNAGTIYPGAADACGDSVDQNCDGADTTCSCSDDLDADGHVSIACGGDDCCDTGADVWRGCTDLTAPTIYPDAPETCTDIDNGIDRDCNRLSPICRVSTPPALPGDRGGARGGRRLPGDAASRFGAWTPTARIASDEPVFVIAVYGDDTYAAANNQGRADLEACQIDDTTGHLACGATWTVQANDAPHDSFGMDAVLYFSYLFPFYGVNRETVNVTPSTRSLVGSSITRFALTDPDLATPATILGARQSASTSFAIGRSYYQITRLMSFVYVIGGWAEAHTDTTGATIPAGPTPTVERHDQ